MPGVRINLSRSGPSLSVGGKGFHENIGLHGTRTTFSLPGTGLSYQTRHSYHHSHATHRHYTVKFREKGSKADFFYFGADMSVQPTPEHSRPLPYAEANAARHRMLDEGERIGEPIECHVVEFTPPPPPPMDADGYTKAVTIVIFVVVVVFLAMVVLAHAHAQVTSSDVFWSRVQRAERGFSLAAPDYILPFEQCIGQHPPATDPQQWKTLAELPEACTDLAEKLLQQCLQDGPTMLLPPRDQHPNLR